VTYHNFRQHAACVCHMSVDLLICDSLTARSAAACVTVVMFRFSYTGASSDWHGCCWSPCLSSGWTWRGRLFCVVMLTNAVVDSQLNSLMVIQQKYHHWLYWCILYTHYVQYIVYSDPVLGSQPTDGVSHNMS